MVCTKSVLIIAIVNSNLYRDRCIDESNDSRRDSNEVRISLVRSTSESGDIGNQATTNNKYGFL